MQSPMGDNDILRSRGNSYAKGEGKLSSVRYNPSNPDFLIGSIAPAQEKAPESLADQIRQRLSRQRWGLCPHWDVKAHKSLTPVLFDERYGVSKQN